jgi:uncharacterized protein YfkK (UPF0435 family)
MTTTNNENILMMFEEISQKLDRNISQVEAIARKQPKSNEDTNLSELQSALEDFESSQSEKLDNIETLIRKDKRKIEFTPTSTFGMAFFLSLMLIVLGLSIWIYSLKSEMGTLADNDLKYRYIQMIGQVSREELSTIDSIFYFNRNRKKIKELRKHVEIFEENVRQRAKILEQEERLRMKREMLEQVIQ